MIRVESTIRDMPVEEIPFDPIIVDAEYVVDEVDIKTRDVEPTVPLPLSLSFRAMMETFMTTQAAY